MKTTALIPALMIAASFSTPAMAISAFDRMIMEELSCEDPPRPTGILQTLVKAKKIDPSDNLGYDSMSCWKIKGGISFLGVNFNSVCAFEEDEFIRQYNKDLYYRAPGTSPGQFISFGTDISGDQLADWYVKIFGPARVSSAINEGVMTNLDTKSEVECNSWMQN